MNRFERDLREVLQRRDPPQGFAEQVLARARATEKPATFSPLLRWLVVAALVVVMFGGFALIQEQRRRAEGERAKQQLMAALRITGTKLLRIQERLSVIQQRTIELHLEQ